MLKTFSIFSFLIGYILLYLLVYRFYHSSVDKMQYSFRRLRINYRKSEMYPSLCKCHVKRCNFCKHLCCTSTKLNLTLITDKFLQLIRLILVEDQLILCMFLLRKKQIGACITSVGRTCGIKRDRFAEHCS